MFDNIFSIPEQNKLFDNFQAAIRSNDFYIDQPISISHCTY